MFKAVLLALIAALHISPTAYAAPPSTVAIEIEYLIGFLAQSGCEFYRNGSWYDEHSAESHLRAKYAVLVTKDQIKTTDDFIEKAASYSSFSGQPYEIRCRGDAAMTTGQWFRAALSRYRGLQ